jgi:hypothetical protein
VQHIIPGTRRETFWPTEVFGAYICLQIQPRLSRNAPRAATRRDATRCALDAADHIVAVITHFMCVTVTSCNILIISIYEDLFYL